AAAAALALVVGLVLAALQMRAHAAPSFVTQPVARQTFVQTVTASGTVNPQNTIAVGSQVSGTISAIGVDYNSTVRKGQVLARLDPTPFQAALAQARASLAQAQAQAQASSASATGSQAAVISAQATLAAQRDTAASNEAAIAAAQANVGKSESALNLAQQTLARDKTLLAQGYVAQSQADGDETNLAAAQATYENAVVSLQQARAQAQASGSQTLAQQAQVQQQAAQAQSAAATSDAGQAAIAIEQAQVEQAQLNLDHTTIASPVDGTVIARNVSVGETVAASFQTPTLFSIAQDLKKMEVDLNVGEPDIGSVKAGDPVSFSVLAYPNETFHGTVQQVRQNPTTISNVVTYQTVVLVDNSSGKLRPGMTASATIQISAVPNALVVPLQALSYSPPSGSVARRTRKTATAAGAPAANAPSAGSSPWGASLDPSAALVAGGTSRVFVERSGSLQVVPVRVDAIEGTAAAVTPLRGTLSAGDAVAIGDSTQAQSAHRSTAPAASSPFAGGSRGLGGIH
ncbi:MAG: efflux RND transporter periplasmic adaptor subunit, partial [Candidatus Baltobacteraceae bacterium]